MDIAKKVNEIFVDCLFRPEEITDGKTPEDAIIVDGIVQRFGFHSASEPAAKR